MTQNMQYARLPEPWKPHAYQKKAVRFLLEHACSALFQDPGMGKTGEVLAALKILKARGMMGRVLLIAPLRVCYSVWPGEIAKWCDFNHLTYVILHGPHKEEALAANADISIINPEGLDWLLKTQKERSALNRTRVSLDTKAFASHGFDILVVDELSKFKHVNTNRFKALKLVLNTFARRWGLTGSPAANGLLDLFGQCFILDQGRSLGPYISHYRMKYFTQSFNGFEWNLREGADQEIYERIAPLALRMGAEDYLELPQLVENIIRVDLPPEARRVYDALEDHLIARIEDKTVVAANAAAASTKCRQVANGGVYLDADLVKLLCKTKAEREWANLHEGKVDALEELIEELGGSPLLVAYDFEHDLDRIKKRLGKDTPHIGGGVTPKRSAFLERAWNEGKLPVLLGHPQAIGHGLNLQGAGNHICWHSLTWNYELFEQMNRRVWRQGNKHSRVFVHLLVAADTIDEAILGALKSKKRGQDALFDALKKLRRKR